ncbi:glycoside hydrolase family 88/105 protein [Sphingomonas alpina]|uniref:Glycoside hydrolase family 88 protein n=1 Tax=Sphingomonas alpina TaxID=653931 RepID=A0A7H0LEX3_9SPHN|nr:glycoside hydrolase family 88 protein [Sphingomonas alpina]QNQ08226.1 glycoside hydrolase family 88 protein [Sphingomonas alpina]
MSMIALAPIALVAAAATPAEPAMPQRTAILAATQRVADWQLAHLDTFDHMPAASKSVQNPRDWQQATFWAALTELADRSREPDYARALLDLGQREQWRPGDRPFHADDQLIAQAWLWTAKHGAGDGAIVPARAYFENVFAHRPTGDLAFVLGSPGSGDPPCTQRWCWCDALFMAPPTLLRMARATGDQRYATFAHEEFRATTDYLFDKSEHLFFRDSRFFDRRDAAGRKLFWSRGNGWVMAGLVRVIQMLDANDPKRPYYVSLFREMAARLVTLQKADGYWAPSLLDNGADTPPETSGTAFFTYAFAWGVDTGLLDRKTYRPAAIKGWAALLRAVQPDGKLGWVQQVSDRPDKVAKEDTQYYGTGAFLLAGTAMADLARHGGGR